MKVPLNTSSLLSLCPCFSSFLLSLLCPSLTILLSTTVDDPDLAPVQPMNTPTIFFDPQNSTPWEFSLNLSSVLPADNSQLRPNSSVPVAHGFLLRIMVELANGTNITDYHYMVGIHMYVHDLRRYVLWLSSLAVIVCVSRGGGVQLICNYMYSTYVRT